MARKRQFQASLKAESGAATLDPAALIERLLSDAEELLCLTISIHDRAGIFATADGFPLLDARRRSHRHPYCRIDRLQRAGWEQKCIDHCQHFVNARLREDGRPFVHLCWKGAREAAVPIMHEGQHLATLFCGVFRPHKGKAAPGGKQFPKHVTEMCHELPAPGPLRLASICRVMETLGQGLLAQLELVRQLEAWSPDRKTEIRRFIHYHAHRPVGLGDLARVLHLSQSRTSHLVRELFGRPFKELLIEERLQRARSLLVSSSLTVGAIAERVGLPNEFYFNRLFKSRVGVPPGAFRRQRQTGPAITREG